MKKMFLALLMPGSTFGVFAQSNSKKTFNKQDFNVYVDIAPLFFAAPAFGFTANVDKKATINFANENFTFKSGLGFGPFPFVGAHFPIFK